MELVTESFFSTLGHLAGTGQQENQFSRAFKACFEHSLMFRRSMLRMLNATCGISGRMREADAWTCCVEVGTPVKGGGRPDITIAAPRVGRREYPAFVLESKLGSPLTFEQLQRYRQHGVKYLIAVTKHEPEILRSELKAEKIFVMRWQDVHRELRRARPSSATDRFIKKSMLEYLEELGMAYREDLTLSDLDRCRRVLNTVATPEPKSIVPYNGFEVADACVWLLDDIRRRVVETRSQLGTRSRSGPGYIPWIFQNRRYHGFYWDLYVKGQWAKDRFGLRLWLSENKRTAPKWAVQHTGSNVKFQYEEFALRATLSRGVLDPGKVAIRVSRYAKDWKVI